MNRLFRISIVGLFALLGVAFVFSCLNLPGCSIPDNSDTIPVYTYNIVNTYPHDRGAFTEGLVLEDGVLGLETALPVVLGLVRSETLTPL